MKERLPDGSHVAPQLSRRRIMQALAVAPAVALPAGLAQAEDAVPADLALAAATMGLISTNVCAVMPETTEGPYYLDPNLVRADITEDREGIPLRLQLQVVTAECRPVSAARIDVWHCDALGNYSGYARQGSDAVNDTRGATFLRGTQSTDASGIATFETIYPGWYRGRTTHIHYKVFLDATTVLTSQIFFPDALSQYLYQYAAPYQRSEVRDTVNASDGIAVQAGEGAYCAIREQKDRYIAALVVGIDPEAQWTEAGQGMGGPPPGPPPDGPPPGDGSGGEGPTGEGSDPATVRMFPGT